MKNTKQWFEQAVPNPTTKNLEVQLGVHLEEVAEMMVAFTVETRSGISFMKWEDCLQDIEEIATLLKTGQLKITSVDANAVLDGITDQ